jgi:hypothetical protein
MTTHLEFPKFCSLFKASSTAAVMNESSTESQKLSQDLVDHQLNPAMKPFFQTDK